MSNYDWLQDLSRKKKHLFLLVEPIAKTPYPPLGLMKISSMLKDKIKWCDIIPQIGNDINGLVENPTAIFITSLFTWDWRSLVDSIKIFNKKFPNSEISILDVGP